jgi:hypothetical protein
MASIPGLSPFCQKAIPLAQSSLAFGSITSSYAQVKAPSTNPLLIVILVSTLDEDVQLSWDGINDHLVLRAGASVVLDFKSDDIVFPANFGVYVKEIGNPTEGSVYVSSFTV